MNPNSIPKLEDKPFVYSFKFERTFDKWSFANNKQKTNLKLNNLNMDLFFDKITLVIYKLGLL